MRSESAVVALQVIRDKIDLAWRFVEGCSYDRFYEDRQIFYAVTRALEIICEASRRLPDDLRDRHLRPLYEAVTAEILRSLKE